MKFNSILFTKIHYSWQIIFLCLSLISTSQSVFAGNETDDESEVKAPAFESPAKFKTPKRRRAKASVATAVTDSGGRRFTTPKTGRVILHDTPMCLAAMIKGEVIYLIHSTKEAMRMRVKRFDAGRFAGRTPTNIMDAWDPAATAELLETIKGVLKHTARCGKDFYVGHTRSARRGRQHGSEIARSVRSCESSGGEAVAAAAGGLSTCGPDVGTSTDAPAAPIKGTKTKKAMFFAGGVREGRHAFRQVIVENIKAPELAELFEGIFMLATEALTKGANTRSFERKAEVEAFYARFLADAVLKLRGDSSDEDSELVDEGVGDDEDEEDEDAYEGDDWDEEDEDGRPPIKRPRFDDDEEGDDGEFYDDEAGLLAATAAAIAGIKVTHIEGVAHSVTVIATARDGNCGFHALAAMGGLIKTRAEFIRAVLAKYGELFEKHSVELTDKERKILALIRKIFGVHSPEAWATYYANPIHWMDEDTLELYADLTDSTIVVHAVNEESVFMPIHTHAGGDSAILHIAHVHLMPTLFATGASTGIHFVGLTVGAPIGASAASAAAAGDGLGGGSAELPDVSSVFMPSGFLSDPFVVGLGLAAAATPPSPPFQSLFGDTGGGFAGSLFSSYPY